MTGRAQLFLETPNWLIVVNNFLPHLESRLNIVFKRLLAFTKAYNSMGGGKPHLQDAREGHREFHCCGVDVFFYSAVMR